MGTLAGILASAYSGGASSAQSKIAVDYVVLLGSSTTDQSFGPAAHPIYGDYMWHLARAAVVGEGIDLPVISKAVSGSTIANLDTNVNTYITELAIPAGKVVAFIINIGSNDIGITTFAGMAQATKDAMTAGLTSIVGKITAAGHIPIIATVNGRLSYEAMYDGWAAGMFEPLCLSLTPDWYSSGSAVFDYCQLYVDNLGVADWFNPDAVHPKLATYALHSYTAQKMDAFMSAPAASGNERVLLSFWLGTERVHGGVNSMVATTSGTLSAVYNSSGQLKSGATISYSGASGGGQTIRAGVGNYDVSVNHWSLHRNYLYTSSGNHTITFAMGAAYAGRTGSARCTFNTSNAGRVSRFTIGASYADVTGNTAGVQYGTVPFTADGSGNIVITVSPASGTYASTSGVELEFDPA